jgi:S1-C subfamily serine protease
MEQIIATGRVSRGWLGVSARDVVQESTGVAAGAALVTVQSGGPADKAGLRAGDTVVAINGREVADTAALVREAAALTPGTRARFDVLRAGAGVVVDVEIGLRPVTRRR